MESKSPLVLLAPRMTDDSKAVWKAALDLGWSIERIQGWRVPENLRTSDRPIVIYGEPLFAEAVADQTGLTLLEPSIDWLTTLPWEFVRRNLELLSLEEARQQISPAFVKPADGKIFEPKVYATGADLPGEEHVDADIPVLRSGIVDFRLEIRCFVKARQVVTLSPYWRHDALALDKDGQWSFEAAEKDEALRFAHTILNDNRTIFPPACTLDIGRFADGEWAVVEANPCWGAGLYGCDPTEVLQCIRAAVLPQPAVTEAEKCWISRRRKSSTNP